MAKHKKTIMLPPGQSAATPLGSLTQQVYETLKGEILRAECAPGEMIAEPELAARYGISKTPIREALRILIQDGWVRARPNKGYLIRPVSLEDVGEVFTLREMLEPELSAGAARRRTEAQLQRLSELAERPAQSSGDLEAALDAVRQFHTLIAEAAGNSRAVRMLEGLLDEVRRLYYLMPELQTRLRSTEVEAHRALVEALRQKDSGQAASRMREHLLDARTAMLDALERLTASRSSAEP
jgi:GntR family transcriptional regulator, rspAB operon transcriptional repressor